MNQTPYRISNGRLPTLWGKNSSTQRLQRHIVRTEGGRSNELPPTLEAEVNAARFGGMEVEPSWVSWVTELPFDVPHSGGWYLHLLLQLQKYCAYVYIYIIICVYIYDICKYIYIYILTRCHYLNPSLCGTPRSCPFPRAMATSSRWKPSTAVAPWVTWASGALQCSAASLSLMAQMWIS